MRGNERGGTENAGLRDVRNRWGDFDDDSAVKQKTNRELTRERETVRGCGTERETERSHEHRRDIY